MKASIKARYEYANIEMIRLVRQSSTPNAGRIRLVVPVKGGRS